MLFRQLNFYLYNEKTSIMSNYKFSKFKSHSKAQHITHLSQVKLPVLQARHQQQDYKLINKAKSNKLLAIQNRVNSRYKSPLKNSHSVLSQISNSRTPDVNMSNGFLENIGEQVNNIIKHNELLNNEYYNSEAQNFQANILKNKELLKLQREKRESILSKNQHKEQPEKSQKEKKWKDSLVKSKRKSVNSSKKINSRLNNAVESANANLPQKNIQSNFTSNSLLKIQNMEHKSKSKAQSSFNNKLQKRVSELKQKLSQRKLHKRDKMFTQGGINESQSQNLFDTIHNYLANPQRCFSNYKNINFKASSLQEKRNHLQAQLNNLEKKQIINSSEQRQGQALKISENSNKNTKDEFCWRRIQLVPETQNNKQFLSVGESNFEKQVNHLGHLQQRNQYSLQRYIQHQRMLYDLKIMKSHSLKQNLRRQFLSK